MIGNLPTIRTEKQENDDLEIQVESSSGYSIPMVNEQEFINSNLLETDRSEKLKPIVLGSRQSSNLLSATDT
jgi:hypothetical protein